MLAVLLSAHTVINAAVLRRPRIDTAPRPGDRSRRLVSVCIPARNEAARIGPTIRSVVAQPRDDVAEILVLDDGSTDATADVVLAAAGGDDRVRVLHGRDLAAGWLGKPHACHQLGTEATGAVLVFLDADVVLNPGAIRSAVDLLDRAGLDLVSPYPRQEAVTPGERLVQPLLQWLWLTFLPLRLAETSRHPSLTAANGQFLVISAEAWRAIGGHGAVRDAVVEDVWLARSVKRAGGRAVVADGTHLATCRMYGSWAELRDGYTKSLWAAFGGRGGATAVSGLLALAYVAPTVGVLTGVAGGRGRLVRRGLAGYAAGVIGRMISARVTGGRVADSLAHPLSICALIMLIGRSIRARRRGGIEWRGRRV
jgi:cellulose synthase/poly-beta-1,6-N-acetylglucosamine synthase-like glycosyltransferase